MTKSQNVLIAFTTLFIFAFSIVFTAHAAEQKQQPVWGVTVHDAGVEQVRQKMIQTVGVDAVITARFQAAFNRLNILDQRIVMLLSKTSNTCTQKVLATKTLASATKTLSAIDTSRVVVPEATTAKLVVDTVAVADIKSALDQSLVDMKSAITTLSLCPQYQVDVITAIPTKK